ncbi:MAG: WGR domain-containing protein [Polyangiaceae bacterium]
MRRFELSEGSSNKFWQIERQGNNLTICFGRIGTNGQTQVKSLGSDAAAQAEHDKLVREKLKKGYREAASAANSAPAAPAKPKAVPSPAATSAEPAPPEATPDVAPAAGSVIAWTPDWLAKAAPMRGSTLVPAQLPPALDSYGRIVKRLGIGKLQLDKRAAEPGGKGAAIAAARALFATPEPPPALDLEQQALGFSCLIPIIDSSSADNFVLFWGASAGAEFALRALLRGISLTEDPTFVKHDFVAWRALRLLAVLASDAEHARLLGLAEKSIAARPTLAPLLAAAFERPDWCAAQFAQASAFDHRLRWYAPVAVSLPNAEELLRATAEPPAQSWGLLHNFAAVSSDLLARYGEQGAVIAMRAVAGGPGSQGAEQVAELLALVSSRDVAQFFVGFLSGKELRAQASQYLIAHPHVSLVPLAIAAVGKTAAGDSARSVLKALLPKCDDALLGAARAELPPAAAQLLQSLEARGPLEEATLAELPQVLQAPPWFQKKIQAPPIVLALSVLPFDESLDPAKADEPQARSYMLERPESLESDLAEVNQALAGGRANASMLARLPKSKLLEITPRFAASQFVWYSYSVSCVLLRRHGLDLLDFVLRVSEGDMPDALSGLALVDSPRVAPVMADVFARLKSLKSVAAEWLLKHSRAAAVGLLPRALGKPGKARTQAELSLRFLAQQGGRPTIESVAQGYGVEAKAAVQQLLEFDPLLEFPSKLPALPEFFGAATFTRPSLQSGKALPASAVQHIGTMLAFCRFEEPYVGLLQVKAACSPKSLAEFGWDVFQAWLVSGASSKEQWALLGLGLFGNDEVARKLAGLIRVWPGESAHARAVTGLDVLARIGSDVSLMHLHGIAQKVKFKGLQERAREKIDEIAEARGFSADELADRLVPDLGLDDDGSLRLDLGLAASASCSTSR